MSKGLDHLIARGLDIKGDYYEHNATFSGSMHLFDQDIKAIEIPDGVTYLDCGVNYLTELEVPEGVETLYCERNYLTTLTIPKSLKYLQCDKELFEYDMCRIHKVEVIYER